MLLEIDLFFTMTFFMTKNVRAPFCMATCNGGQWQDLMLHQISQEMKIYHQISHEKRHHEKGLLLHHFKLIS